MKKSLYFWLTALFLFLAAIDRFTKFFYFKNPDSGFLLFDWGFLRVDTHFFQNAGLSFSIPFPQIFSLVLSGVLICLFLFLFIGAVKKQRGLYPLIFVLVGAFSNFADRLFLGFVIDWFSFEFFSWRASIINLADIYIVIGLIVWIYLEETKHNTTRE